MGGRLARIATAVLLCAGAPAPAAAFGTVNAFGFHAEHRQITRGALSCPKAGAQCWSEGSLAALAGGRFGGAVGRPDLTLLTFSAKAHCDNGDHMPGGYPRTEEAARKTLERCREWIRQSIERAVAEAGAMLDAEGALRSDALRLNCGSWWSRRSSKCRAIREFGQALHATQDFYSHTNWVDRPDPDRPIGTDNPDGLGRSEPAEWLALRGDVPPPAGLISGCFQGVPEWAFCGARVKHDTLNKDKGRGDLLGPGATPRGKIAGNFQRATQAAMADTVAKWRLLQVRLVEAYGAERGALMACLIRQDQAEACVRSKVGGGRA